MEGTLAEVRVGVTPGQDAPDRVRARTQPKTGSSEARASRRCSTFWASRIMCGKTRKTGRFIVKRKTIRKRLSAKLSELKEELRRRWHQPVAEVGKWLKSVVQGYFNYHAVPGNMDSLNSFRAQVIWRWYRALRRRSQRDRMTWERFWRLVDRWIPSAKILHPHPNVRFDARYPR